MLTVVAFVAIVAVLSIFPAANAIQFKNSSPSQRDKFPFKVSLFNEKKPLTLTHTESLTVICTYCM